LFSETVFPLELGVYFSFPYVLCPSGNFLHCTIPSVLEYYVQWTKFFIMRVSQLSLFKYFLSTFMWNTFNLKAFLQMITLKWILEKQGVKNVGCIQQLQDRVQWWASVNTAMKLWVP